MNLHNFEPLKSILDVLSVTTVLATLTAWLPPLAALLGVVWWAIRIYFEIKTGQRKLREKRQPHCEVCGQEVKGQCE